MAKPDTTGNAARSMAAAPLHTDPQAEAAASFPGPGDALPVAGDIAADVATALAAKSLNHESALPWELVGFKLNVRKSYPQTEKGRDGIVKEIGTSQGVADIVLKMKGGTIPSYMLGRVSRVIPTGSTKGSFRFSLPASQQAGGAYAASVIKSDSVDEWNAALDRWKNLHVAPLFQAWGKSQPMLKAAAIAATVNAGNGLIEIDLD